jgi:hypothetical protein
MEVALLICSQGISSVDLVQMNSIYTVDNNFAALCMFLYLCSVMLRVVLYGILRWLHSLHPLEQWVGQHYWPLFR